MQGIVRFAKVLAVRIVLAAGLHAQAPKAHITLTGGPQAGSYDMVGSPVCDTYDSGAEDHGFGAEFVADPPHGWRKGPPYLSHLWLSTPRIRNPKPEALSLGVTFSRWGTPTTEIDYKVFTIPPALDHNPGLGRKQTGKGQATVHRTGDKLSATFSGETADGIRMEGSVECR